MIDDGWWMVGGGCWMVEDDGWRMLFCTVVIVNTSRRMRRRWRAQSILIHRTAIPDQNRQRSTNYCTRS